MTRRNSLLKSNWYRVMLMMTTLGHLVMTSRRRSLTRVSRMMKMISEILARREKKKGRMRMGMSGLLISHKRRKKRGR